jgi:PTH1 family peptidyl-tRNA hydrolase
LRFGIGNDFPKGMQSDFVLGKWKKEEEALVKLKIDRSVEVIEIFATQGIATAMNAVNNQVFSL